MTTPRNVFVVKKRATHLSNSIDLQSSTFFGAFSYNNNNVILLFKYCILVFVCIIEILQFCSKKRDFFLNISSSLK